MKRMRPNWLRVLAAAGALLAFLLLASCAPGANTQVDVPSAQGLVAGFWRGLWHGLIAPITFLISLFSSGVSVYEIHNSGGWYNFGFLLGLSVVFGGGARGGRWGGGAKAPAP